MDVNIILLFMCVVIFFGFLAELIFRKWGIPDVIFLITFGFVVGPYVLNYVNPSSFSTIAPLFTTFTLLFLLFDGSFNIKLSSLLKEFLPGFLLTIFNFVISVIIIAIVALISGFNFVTSLFMGFVLGGISSAFVVPLLKQIKPDNHVYSILVLESALTDVFCIVFSLSLIEIFRVGSFGLQSTLTQLVSFFAIAGLIGIIGGVLWIIIVLRVLKEHNYMMTVAFLLFVYFITEFLGGNGAIASLFFGLTLTNYQSAINLFRRKNIKKVTITTPSEHFFYDQISFFLKTFFFVYIGLLLDLSNWKALVIGGIISIVIFFGRMLSRFLNRSMSPDNKFLIKSIFARGLAAAAIVQLALIYNFPQAEFIAKITYIVIVGTIILSSASVFWYRLKFPKKKKSDF